MTKHQRLDSLLAILQQSEYDLRDFSRWYQQHASNQQVIEQVAVEKWTAKLKLIKKLYLLLPFLSEELRLRFATQLTTPIEAVIRKWYYIRAKQKLSKYRKKGLSVVAIAGSYAKTSTKHIMKHLLSNKKKVLITPKSINTLLGISQVILEDLHTDHQVFIVEFGEYNQEDVKNLTAFTEPDYAVLTPIGRQHLERFGSLQNIAQTFQPLVNFFTSQTDKLLLSEQNSSFFKGSWTTYGNQVSSDLYVENVTISKRGTEFAFQNTTIFSPLFGEHQAVNTLASFWIAKKLDIPQKSIVTACATIPYINRRHEPHFGQNDVLILDNSYNTNPDSVTASLDLLDQLQPSKKIMITPGFVELGEQSEAIHTQFGEELYKRVDAVGLIRNNAAEMIKNSFVKSGGKKSDIVIADTIEEALSLLSAKIEPGSVVLFEGGYREIYDTK